MVLYLFIGGVLCRRREDTCSVRPAAPSPCSTAAELRPAGRRHVVAWWASFGAINFAALVGPHGAAALGAGSQGDRGDAVNGGRLDWLHDAALGRRWVDLTWKRPRAAQKRMISTLVVVCTMLVACGSSSPLRRGAMRGAGGHDAQKRSYLNLSVTSGH